MKCVRLLLVFWVFCLSYPAYAAISSQVDRNTLEQGDSFVLVLNISQSDAAAIDLSPLEEDFEIVRRSHQSTTSIVNGEMHSSTKLVLTLAPKRAGKLEVPALTLDEDKSQVHPIDVTPMQMQSAVNGGVELLSSLSDPSPRVQQPVVYQLSLVLGQPIANAVFEEPKITRGKALIQPLGDQKQYRQQLKGREILVVEQSWLITPQQSGELEVSAAKLSAEMSNSTSPYRRFNDPRAIRRIYLSADSYRLDVAPIPADFQGSNWLPATGLELRGELSSDSWKVGEPVTRTITLQAEGVSRDQLAGLSLPEVDGIKQYAAKPVYQQHQSGDQISASMALEVTLIPGREGEITLPEIRIPWWNTQTNQAEEAILAAQTLTVTPGNLQVLAEEPPPAEISVTGPAQEAPLPATQASMVNPDAEEQTSLITNISWWWLLLAAVIGGVAGSLFTRMASHGQRQKSGDDATVDKTVAAFSRKDLRHACTSNDPYAARSALLAWGRETYGCTQLNSLQNRVSAELREAIQELNACCYAEAASAWDGSRLFSLVKAQPRPKPAQWKEAPLAPLIPG